MTQIHGRKLDMQKWVKNQENNKGGGNLIAVLYRIIGKSLRR